MAHDRAGLAPHRDRPRLDGRAGRGRGPGHHPRPGGPGPHGRRGGHPPVDRLDDPPHRRVGAGRAGRPGPWPGGTALPPTPRGPAVPAQPAPGRQPAAEHHLRPRRGQEAAPGRHHPQRPRARRWAATGPHPDPRWRLGDRRQARAGDPAAQPHGGPGVGRVQRQLPPQPLRQLSRSRDRREAGHRVDPRARRRVRCRPRLPLHHRRVGRGPPLGARGPHVERAPLPARIRGSRHEHRRGGALLRHLRLHAGGRLRLEPSPLLPLPRALGDEGLRRRGAGEVPGRVARPPHPGRRAAVLHHPRRPRHPRPGGGCSHLRRAAAGRLEGAGRCTPRCRARSTRSRSSRRSGPPR